MQQEGLKLLQVRSLSLTNILKIHKKLEPMHNALFIETSPSPVKYVLSKMGRIEDELRLPLVNIRQETREILDKVISDLDLI